MKLRVILLLLILVLLPVGVMSWAAVRMADDEQLVFQQRYRELTRQRLQDLSRTVTETIGELEREMRRATRAEALSVDLLRELTRREPRVRQMFALSAEGDLLHPNPAATSLNADEEMFLLRASEMFTGRSLYSEILLTEESAGGAVVSDDPPAGKGAQTQSRGSRQTVGGARQSTQAGVLEQMNRAPGGYPEAAGWFIWYWDQGLHLIYWQRQANGVIVGAALERARWIADLIGDLPASIDDQKQPDSGADSVIRLVDAESSTIYRWGNPELPIGTEPFCEVPLSVPLSSWRLQSFVPESALLVPRRSALVGLAGALPAAVLAVACAGLLLYREYSREMQTAARQVTFVNQVSHELKTPLTNIRMYAELLESDLDGFEDSAAEKPQQRLEVILAESRRLSRLIGNVLAYASSEDRTPQLQYRRVSPDEILIGISERFRPSLEEAGVELCSDMQAPLLMPIDTDALEQIVGNLISNVEKYAAAGRQMMLKSRQHDRVLMVEVCDNGPGIPASLRERVFMPFFRESNAISHAAGTGIGLTIARRLARAHGGDLTLENSETGCCFRLTLRSPAQYENDHPLSGTTKP